MKLNKILAMAALAFVAVSCSDNEEPDGGNDKNPAEIQTKEMLVKTADYTVWTYINLKTGETATATVPGPWWYNGVEDKENPENNIPAKFVDPEIKGQVPAEWDIAVHYYEVRTNGTEAVKTNFTKFDEVTSLPAEGWVADESFKAEDAKMYVDMKGMMNGVIGYGKGTINPSLCSWVTKTPTGGMPPYKYTVEENIFVVKCKNGAWAKIKFLDRLDENGKKAVKFQYQYISK